MKIYCRNPVLMHCAPPPRTAPHRTVMDVPRCGVVPSGPSRVSVPRHGHGRARARIRTRAQSRERERERDSPSERGRHSRRERSFVVCPPPVGIYHSRVVLPRAGGVMQQCYLPPRLMRRRRSREGERQRSRRRGRGRRGGECLCLAVMAYSQGRSGRTKPRTLSRHLARVERILSSSLSNRKDRASVGP